MKPQESAPYDAREIKKLRVLVAKGEGQTLELKRKATYPEKIVREMIAFANTKGGTLLVGINDNGTIPGLKFPEDESHAIRKALIQCRPSLNFTEIFIPIGNSRTVLLYNIPESKNKLHFILNAANQKESFVRVEDKSIKASREVREIFRRNQYNRDIQFRYGDHEQLLIKYLDNHTSITLNKFIELSKLKRFYASKKLVTLVLADVLQITPHEKGDLYSLAFIPD